LLMRHLMRWRGIHGHCAHASSMLDVSDGSSSTSAGSVMRAAPVPPYTRTRYLFQQSLEWLPNCWDWTLSILRYLVARITSFFLHHAIFRWTIQPYHDIKVSCIGEITREERNIIDSLGGKKPLKAEDISTLALRINKAIVGVRIRPARSLSRSGWVFLSAYLRSWTAYCSRILVAWICRLNKFVTLVGVYVTNPWTIVPIYTSLHAGDVFSV